LEIKATTNPAAIPPINRGIGLMPKKIAAMAMPGKMP
jgi:hypothetical protein